jgi:hypothetical protein
VSTPPPDALLCPLAELGLAQGWHGQEEFLAVYRLGPPYVEDMGEGYWRPWAAAAEPEPVPVDLDQLDALAAAATPGPWLVDRDGDVVADRDRDSMLAAYPSAADAALIVAAVNALPALVAAARERDQLRAAVLTLADEADGYPLVNAARLRAAVTNITGSSQ